MAAGFKRSTKVAINHAIIQQSFYTFSEAQNIARCWQILRFFRLWKRVWFLHRLIWKRVHCIDFAYFGLESGMVFEGKTGLHERICHFHSKWIRKSERVICDFEMDLLLNGYGLLLWWHNFVLRKCMLWVLRVGRRIWNLRGGSEKECGKWLFWSENGVRTWRTGWRTPHQEEPPTGKSANCL